MPFCALQTIVQNVENFFGNVKDIKKNTYYAVDRRDNGNLYREEIMHCLTKVQLPYFENYRSLANETYIGRLAKDESKHISENTSGLYL